MKRLFGLLIGVIIMCSPTTASANGELQAVFNGVYDEMIIARVLPYSGFGNVYMHVEKQFPQMHVMIEDDIRVYDFTIGENAHFPFPSAIEEGQLYFLALTRFVVSSGNAVEYAYPVYESSPGSFHADIPELERFIQTNGKETKITKQNYPSEQYPWVTQCQESYLFRLQTALLSRALPRFLPSTPIQSLWRGVSF